MKKLFLIAFTLLLSLAGTVHAEQTSGYTVIKVSNPDSGERDVDGLINGGDRENSYTWRLAMRGDEIYIATTRNIASALVNMYGSAFASAGISLDTFWALIDVVTNGDIPRNDANEGANIISYNRKTGDFKVVYTAETGNYFRMAVTFGDNVYFGSYSASPENAQYILKLDSKGNFSKVFQTMGSVSLRANCEYDGHLFFAGADDREVVDPNDERTPTKMAVLRKSNDDDNVWERVADYKDFGEIAYDGIMSSWAGAPIWELASHKGYIYATAPSTPGFVIFRGRPAQDGESANEYGWHWEEVAGLNNGINNPGLSDVEGGEPGTMRSLIGSVYEFKGELYAYNFDHSFGGEAQAFAGMLQQMAGKDVKASEYLSYMYNSLQNPQKVWKLDDNSGKFVECKKFTELMEGTTNEYVWRMGTYNNQLYVSTMDAGIFYGYMTQLTNGNFFKMTLEERLTKIQYLERLIDILGESSDNATVKKLLERIKAIKAFLEQYVDSEMADENSIEITIHYQEMLEDVLEMIQSLITLLNGTDIDEVLQSYLNGDTEALMRFTGEQALVAALINEAINQKADPKRAAQFDGIGDIDLGQLRETILALLETLKINIQDIYDRIDIKGLNMYLYINHAVMNDEWGFDLLRTSDGENFEVITRDGFGDKYNYGCPSFLETEEGLYIGTCNPFYGGQLFLLTNNTSDVIKTIIPETESNIYYTLTGIRIVGKPTEPGIYIKDNKKVIVR